MKAFIVLGNQLFPQSYFTPFKDHHFFMAESVDLCTHFKYHKHKIIFFLSSMRHFKEELVAKEIEVSYFPLNPQKSKNTSYLRILKKFIKDQGIKSIDMYEVEDLFFEREIINFFKINRISFRFHQTPMFQCSRTEFKNYLSKSKKPFMKTFYEGERKRLNLMIEKDGRPTGGKWSFDEANRKKYPKKIDLPIVSKDKKLDSIDKKVIEVVDILFPDHPGISENFWIPTTRKETKKQFNSFIRERLESFGNYQDAISSKTVFGFHSVISPMVNLGFLTPKFITSEMKKIEIREDNINSIEGFLRQIIGWREFVRGIYQNFDDKQQVSNFFNHNRKLNPDYWYGKRPTGIEVLDDCIKKAIKYSYNHHIERLMIVSNVMLLLEIHPQEVYKWFMEMFADSSDWVMGPNVFGMGQFSDGGVFATKPYISGSNYILKMSDYKKGEWCHIWDGLYWKFMEKHRPYLSKNPRMALTCKHLDKMDKEKKEMIYKAAKEFQEKVTIL